jgi:hypothetical protein
MDESKALKRLRYFTGQVLTVESLELEQQYFREKLKRHNRTLHGFGIVSGLNVTVKRGAIIVESGLALDCEGNELVVSSAQSLPVPATIESLSSAFVSLRYVEEETEFASAATMTESAALETVRENYNRGHRHLRARWLACGQAHPLTIAKLRRSSHGWRVERGYRPPTIK